MSPRLLLGAGIVLGLAFPAAAQTGQSSATTVIYGTVPTVCTVDLGAASAMLQLETGPQALTSVEYTCNSPNGFTRRISSQNGGALRRGTQAIPYLISQSGSGALAVGSTSLGGPYSDQVPAFDQLVVGSGGTLSAEIPAVPAGLFAGDYTDTVTIEITPN